MRVAILGATSMLAADFVAFSLARGSPYAFTLFARDPAQTRAEMALRGVSTIPEARPLDGFAEGGADGAWDAIVNFVGVGDPARAVAMGVDILSVTRDWDDRVLAYLEAHPGCRYVFMSSGAAFGAGVADPVTRETWANFAINDPMPSAFYGIAKFYAEAVHRSRPDRSIVDVRIFNYLGRFADLGHRFLVNEAIAAIRDGRVLGVDAHDIWRDYLGTEDLANLLDACLDAPVGYNGAVDAYSLSPISKQAMLALLHDRFGLAFAVSGGGIDATGAKSQYFSRNRAAHDLGYRPRSGSADTLTMVVEHILAAGH